MATCYLKTILDSEGIAQVELARKSGVSSTSISRYACGKKAPSPRTANKIRIALNKFPNISKQYELKDIFPTIK
ncbi:MAG: helix-turn-helix transcriptional regulator [Tannerellaceae bacterium]|jgi:transcriptional regulator with XRE-family HTH domain|nr:helix-turn-helix transcriptional regulator [Tannerellaceae bacterium]